jgi:hypothetical protein
MSPAKKQNAPSPVPAWLQGLGSWLLGRGRPLLLTLLLAGLFAGGAIETWRWIGPRVLRSPQYRVTAERVEITPPPEWIHSDVRAEVFRDPALDGPLSLMDDDLAERIYKAFARHPWVAKVIRVNKQNLKVELVYRRPVCMVEVPGGLLPVDGEGVLLPPGDFSPSEAAGYPRLTGVERGSTVAPGSRWPDAKVLGGAEIAAVIGPAWGAMRLQRIVPLAADPAAAAAGGPVGGDSPPTGRRSSEPFFALLTGGGSRILWGYAPGVGAMGELPAAEKLARLQRYLADHDTLEGRQGQPQELDVRTMRPSV